MATVSLGGYTYQTCIKPESTYPTDTYTAPEVGDGGYYTGGGTWDGNTPPLVPTENLEYGGSSDPKNNHGACDEGNPVSIASGNKHQSETDFVGSGRLPLMITREYNSLDSHLAMNKGFFGQGWSTNLSERVIAIDIADPNDRSVLIETGSGMRMRLTSTNGGPWLRSNGKEEPFHFDSANENWLWVDQGIRKTFLMDGELYQVRHPGGEYITVEYDSNDTFAAGGYRPQKFVHSSGRELAITWDSSDRITVISDPAGRAYSYSYDADGNLTTVTHPLPGSATGTTTYLYALDYGIMWNALTGIRYSPNANYTSGYAYFSNQRGYRTANYDGANLVEFAYTSDTAPITRRVTNPHGKQTNYTFQLIAERQRVTSVNGLALGSCLAANMSYTYDLAGFYDKVTDWEGNQTDYDYDSHGLLSSMTTAYGTTDARTTTYAWHPVWEKPTEIDAPLLRTTFVYEDSSGLLQSVTRTNKSTYGVANESRTTSFSYLFHSNGQMSRMTVDGPRTDVSDTTEYHYDTLGRLTSTVNALGHTTTFQNFDAYGRPQTINFPSGLVRQLTYHPRGMILTSTDSVDGTARTTTFLYFPNGDLETLTRADGSSLDFVYDDSRRLVSIIDDANRHRDFEYDVASNVIHEEIWQEAWQYVWQPDDPNCNPFAPPFPECPGSGSFQWVDTMVMDADYEYDALSRLTKRINGNGQTEEFGYNKNNQLAETVDGFSRSTTVDYNANNEIDDTTYRDGGLSQVTYDDNGLVSGVRDAEGKWTYYERDGFGQVERLVSPATGPAETVFTYDKAGNVTTRTDARGIVTTYTYDALNRLKTSKSGSLAQIAYTYDTNREGFLYQVTDHAGTHTFVSNEAGEPTSRTSVVSGTSMTVSWTYDMMGRVDVMTYPSGLNVDYDYDSVGDLSKIRAWSSGMSARDVVHSVESLPWGPVGAFTYGNGELRQSGYDLGYRRSSLSSGSHYSRYLGYDANGNLTQIGSGYRSFGYDEMDRVASHTGPDGSYQYDYDLNGNRNWHKLGSSTTYYNYTSSRYRLLSRTGAMSETRAYDANGNTTRIGSQYFDHDAANRLWRYRYGSQTVTYAHSAFGERMLKTEGSTQTRFMYDGWRLIHERQGSTKRDYIYLDGEVVGFVKNNVLYYVHNDQIGRPEIITNASQTKVWEAQNNAFGNVPVLDGIGGFNVGFPGQYYDQESGTYYNYFRTYEASAGRYLQTDPINIYGGLNTYVYSENNPVKRIDPWGLIPGNFTIYVKKEINAIFDRWFSEKTAQVRETVSDCALCTVSTVIGMTPEEIAENLARKYSKDAAEAIANSSVEAILDALGGDEAAKGAAKGAVKKIIGWPILVKDIVDIGVCTADGGLDDVRQ